jgi:hypothetical protein
MHLMESSKIVKDAQANDWFQSELFHCFSVLQKCAVHLLYKMNQINFNIYSTTKKYVERNVS